MKKYIIAGLLLSAVLGSVNAQVYKTATGNIKFVSKTAIEEFSANNDQVTAAFSPKSNAIAFRVPVNSFQFKSALMQKHFQENYMQTAEFPFSTYSGKIDDFAAVQTASGNFTKNGSYDVVTKGTHEMHGVKKEITVPGKITITDGVITLSASMNVLCSDYGINIPAASKKSVSDSIAIAINCPLQLAKSK
ncbi:MAG: hypothetical protein RLZZ252_1706 [Bacteroidota bacterium]|jgi:polyisoprenoid-binding protein YceI